MVATTLMIQGTTSDAGKSAVVTGLCRLLARAGVRVAPFKPQNMALNSAVAADGGEIGRAQAEQAAAAGLEPSTDMNPVLLKPTGERNAQLIVDGRAVGHLDAQAYRADRSRARAAALAAHARLAERFDVVLVEGAGSPAEINLRANDFANMGFAEAVDCPVVLVGDIDRGGVFAQLVGTLALLAPSERARIRALVINRFRGDRALLDDGLEWLAEYTGKPVLGVLPWLESLHLAAEDTLSRAASTQSERDHGGLRVAVPALPRMSNHTDFDPLRLHPDVTLRFVEGDAPIPGADLYILPGSKHTRADLAWLQTHGWATALQRHLRFGGRVMGICGGFQMLGRAIHDPAGVEGTAGSSTGFGLLDIDTQLSVDKQLRRVAGRLTFADAAVTGYEIHAGVTCDRADGAAVADLGGHLDGLRSPDDQVLGTYLHGIFDASPARTALLQWAGLAAPSADVDHRSRREAGFDRLADACRDRLDRARLAEILDLSADQLAPSTQPFEPPTD